MPRKPYRKLEPQPVAQLLIDVKSVAVMLGVCERTVYRFDEAGLMPKHLKVGRLVRWAKSEIERWIADGCPPQKNG